MTVEGGTTESPSSPSLASIAGEAVRFLGILTASVYGIGVIIVNIDLSRYGLTTIDLAKSEYLFVGGLAFFLVGLAGLGCRGALYAANYAPYQFLHEHDPPGRQSAPSKDERLLPIFAKVAGEFWVAMTRRLREARRRGIVSTIFNLAVMPPLALVLFAFIILLLLIVVLAVISLYLAILIATLALLSRKWPQDLTSFMPSIIVLTLISFLPTYCYGILTYWLRNRHVPGADLWFPLVFVMPYVAAALISYSYLVYPHLAPQWGGGRKEPIQIIFASDVTKSTIPWASRQDFPLLTRGGVLELKAYLLLETDQTLAITTRPLPAALDFSGSEPPVVVVNKRLISAVLYKSAPAERRP